MEWMNRAGRPAHPGQTVAPEGTGASAPHSGGKKKAKSSPFGMLGSGIIIVSVAIVAMSLIALLALQKNKAESNYVESDQFQAVFLSGGQVYFGKIRELNASYVGMDNIYYLRVNQQVQPKQGETAQQDISLVKLGCELHGPADEMFINRDQVIFWENLKGDGQVAKAVAEYVKQNPNGQNCAANNNSTNTDNSGNTENNNSNNSNESNNSSESTNP